MNIYDKIIFYYSELGDILRPCGIILRLENILSATVAFYLCSIFIVIDKLFFNFSKGVSVAIIFVCFILPWIFNMIYMSDQKMSFIYTALRTIMEVS
jgi:hypothetical protein